MFSQHIFTKEQGNQIRYLAVSQQSIKKSLKLMVLESLQKGGISKWWKKCRGLESYANYVECVCNLKFKSLMGFTLFESKWLIAGIHGTHKEQKFYFC